MSKHSYTRIWLHLIWGTLNREKFLGAVETRKKVSKYLYTYAKEKEFFMLKNYVNSEHVHCLIDLPTRYSIEELMQLLKGSSSAWINRTDLLTRKFAWGRGYAVFSVSHSNKDKVLHYIANQAEHHRTKTFREEYGAFIKNNNLVVLKEY